MTVTGDAIARIRKEFIQHLPPRLGRIRAAFDGLATGFDAGAAHRLGLELHRLAGAAGSFGASEVSGLAGRAEEAARGWCEHGGVTPAELKRASDLLDELASAIGRFVGAEERTP